MRDADNAEIQEAASKLASSRGVVPEEIKSLQPFRFDLIVSNLTMHHVPSLLETLRIMFNSLRPGGYVALTDFEDFGEEAMLFHPKTKWEGVERHGLKAAEMREAMKEAGFLDVDVSVSFTMSKAVEREQEGKPLVLDFPFLMCFGRKA